MIILNGQKLTIETLVQVSRFQAKVSISKKAKDEILKAQAFVEEIVDSGRVVYGINTGFGKLSDQSIPKAETNQLQLNLIRSHATAMGAPLPEEVVRAMMTSRINALVKGYSGIRLETLEKMVELLNKHVTPVVFEQGSLGASGDLALLSHMALPLVGEGEVFYKGKRMATPLAFEKANITALSCLKAKEGLSLINGTQAMSGLGALCLYDAFQVLNHAELALAMTSEALHGIIDAFDDRIHQVRGHKGQIQAARLIRSILSDSKLITRQGELRVQDAYSIRCAPQVHGAILDTLWFVKQVIETELNAVSDNPILFVEDQDVISAGNFHGEPLAFALDYLGIVMAECANISERRLERLVNPALSNGLPAFLASTCGINSGFMIVQYTAAAIVSENKVLAHPASVDSIPSSANQEDHVSMGSISARKARTIVDNARRVVALELLTACQALQFRDLTKLSSLTKAVHQEIRKTIPYLHLDETLYPHMHEIERIVRSNVLLKLPNGGEMKWHY